MDFCSPSGYFSDGLSPRLGSGHLLEPEAVHQRAETPSALSLLGCPAGAPVGLLQQLSLGVREQPEVHPLPHQGSTYPS